MNDLELFEWFCLQYNKNINELKISAKDKVKEFLQIKILEFINTKEYKEKLTLVGWSAIRLFYESNRLSDDLDFNTVWLSEEDFVFICNDIKKYLINNWHQVSWDPYFSNYYHCDFIVISDVFDGSDMIKDVSIIKLKIKIDAAESNWDYFTDYVLPNKTIQNIPIKTTSANILLSKKIIAFLSRNHDKSRLKDLYDVIFLLKSYHPDFNILYEYENISSYNQLFERLFSKIKEKEELLIWKIDELIRILINTQEISSLDDLIYELKIILSNK